MTSVGAVALIAVVVVCGIIALSVNVRTKRAAKPTPAPPPAAPEPPLAKPTPDHKTGGRRFTITFTSENRTPRGFIIGQFGSNVICRLSGQPVRDCPCAEHQGGR
jgi:hypothetical protein